MFLNDNCIYVEMYMFIVLQISRQLLHAAFDSLFNSL